MQQQLTLGISLRDDATFDNYCSKKNELVVHALQEQEETFVLLFGKNGTGKSHLLQAACHDLGQQSKPVVYLPLAEDGIMAEMLDGLESMDLIALDDIQSVVGDEKWELALFNLYNRARDKGARIIVSSDVPLKALNIDLMDLKSRFSWGPTYQLELLSDEEKIKVLQHRAKLRGLELDDDVVIYILKRIPRDMNSLFTILEKLDQASMIEKRKLTIPFVKNYI